MSDTEFAKTHLKEHLCSLLVGPISEGFWSIYSSSKELCEKNGQLDQILRTFQNMLTRIPEWTESTLKTEVERIQKASKCSYLDDLIMGVFIAYMKSFASLHYAGKSEIKIDFDRPSLSKFVHELYKHSARKIWQVAYLFKTVGVSSEQQARNRQDVEKLITECMEQVVRGFLPWESITKKYFNDSSADEHPAEEEDEEDEEVVGESKSVTFGEYEDDSEEEDKPRLKMLDEVATISITDLDEKPKEEAPKVEEEEIDPLEELRQKATETLVINL
jgi:hypothetical protein